MSSVLSCKGLTKRYQDGVLSVDVLKNLDLDVAAGESHAIVGASGSGKSTLLHCLGGLDDFHSGSVSLLGSDLAGLTDSESSSLRNQALGFVYQFHHLMPEFTAQENIAMSCLIAGVAPSEAMSASMGWLERVGLKERALHKPAELSGGERQRVAILRALANNPACILADEPTGNLDRDNAALVFDLLLELVREKGVSLVVVSHDHQMAGRLDQQWQLDDGQLKRLSI